MKKIGMVGIGLMGQATVPALITVLASNKAVGKNY